MLHSSLSCIWIIIISVTMAVEFPSNPTSDMSADEKITIRNKSTDVSENDESGHEIDGDVDDTKDKKMLSEAMKTVLDTNVMILGSKNVVDTIKTKLEMLENDNKTLDKFMDEMDKLSLQICKTSQQALWSYVTDINNEYKKNRMVNIAAEEDEIKRQYWNILKKKYLNPYEIRIKADQKLRRKLRIIKERGTNVQMPQSKQREEIDMMQRIWSRVTLCAYNSSTCTTDESTRTMNDVISVFKVSSDSKELKYYWKAYRDSTGRKIRPIFQDYVIRMNEVAKAENYADAGDMWRYTFEDYKFYQTVNRIWTEIKPFYELLLKYVRNKLKKLYPEDLRDDNNLVPAHITGNLWAQEWQVIYPKVAAYPKHKRPELHSNEKIDSKDLFNAVDDFHQSLGFESARETYENIREETAAANCLPSSHDMCDGVNYKIKWCGEQVIDVAVGLSRAARLLGHIQYFKHYRNLSPLYRDGPNPAFHDAVSDIVAIQLISPNHLKTLKFVKMETGPEVTLNHQLWLALEKLPLMAYAYVLDKWRWDIFANDSLKNWNQYWWDLRTNETGITPPVPRDENDLDPAAKYHVVSHVQYITYLVSHVLEFQLLASLCKKVNHTGPLHECSLYGVKEAGKLLSNGMALGASEDWKRVLYTIIKEKELSTQGILEYFKPLQEFLMDENKRFAEAQLEDMDQWAPIIVGAVVVVLTIIIIGLYCIKKYNLTRMCSVCGLSKNGSLDIATYDVKEIETNDTADVCEDKV